MLSAVGMTSRVLFWIFVPFICGVAWAAEIQTTSGKPTSLSLTPIVSYTPTYGVVFGGGLFQKQNASTGLDFGFSTLISTKPNVRFEILSTYRTGAGWNLRADMLVSSFYAPYYGEGDSTRVEDRVNIAKIELMGKFGPEIYLSERWILWPYIDYRGWHEHTVTPYFPREDTFGAAVSVRYEDRKAPPAKPSTIEQRHELTLRAVPRTFTTRQDLATFYQGELDLRLYWNFTQPFQFASRFYGAMSSDHPSFMYRYYLGGARLLRGFYDNRFRGKHMVTVQEELRFPIWRMVSGVAFLDAGDVTDDRLRRLRVGYGMGLRFALPPDYVAKVRMDIGFSEDQAGFFMLYGDTF